jgi:hypothetical protein
LEWLEPWCDNIYVDNDFSEYIKKTQPNTGFDLRKRILPISSEKINDIIIEFDGKQLNQERFLFITELLPDVIEQSGEIGDMEYDIFLFKIKALTTHQNNLIKI